MIEEGFDWLTYGLGVLSGLPLALFLRWRFRPKRPHLDRPPALPVVIPPQLLPQIRLLKAEQRELEAIKMVRKATGCDLKAAKDAVMALR